MSRLPTLVTLCFFVLACQPQSSGAAPTASDAGFDMASIAELDRPWAMTFLPQSSPAARPMALITEKAGKLILWNMDGNMREISGLPDIAVGGQGGLGDVILHPQFQTNRQIYISFVEGGDGGYGAAVARATLNTGFTALSNVKIIWRQSPKMTGRGHFGHRMAFGPDGMLYISSGERQAFTPAQDMTGNLGKIVRITENGDIPPDNPFFDQGGVTAQIWSLGHRNPLGLAFAPGGALWESEMGPQGGDELNLIKAGGNYGYPHVSNGSHYGGADIPDHAPGDGFVAPKAFWNPSISPGSLMIYSGTLFPDWHGDAFVGALSGRALIRITLNGETAQPADIWPMERRIREVEQGPDGAIYLLEDGPHARLLRLTPKE